ncbi:hypothetical protein PMAYCL1PPCAC_03270, partial [Pristionchus mayeri]
PTIQHSRATTADVMDFLGPSTSDLVAALEGRSNGSSRHSPASVRLNGIAASSRNSSQASFKDSEKRSLHSEQEEMATMAPLDLWKRVRAQCLAIRKHQEERAEYLRELDDHTLQAALSNREVASVKQNAEIAMDRLMKKVAAKKMRVTKKRLGACDITEAQDKKEEVLRWLNSEIAKMEANCTESEAEMARLRPRLYVLRELLRHRRQQMLGDVVDIFRIRTSDDALDVPLSSSRQKCACPERHYIGAIHLPWTTRLPGHEDTTLTAGFTLLVQMLQLVCSITDNHLRYPLSLQAAGAEISTSDGVPLSLVSNARNKADRQRLDAATTLLLRNLAQLRSDCGVHTKRMERTLFVLDDITRVLARGEPGEMPAAFARPWNCSYSIASLMTPPPETERSVVQLPCPVPAEENEEPSFISQGVEMKE